MLLPVRYSFALVVSLATLAVIGCGKKEEDPVVLPMPSAAIVPVKAVQDTAPAVAETATAAPPPTDASAAPAAPEPPKPVAQQSIDGCCSALAGMLKDPKTSAQVKSKATAASAMCGALAKQVKSGTGSRTTALTQIKATMAGNAPSACN
jgi:hypothetical protein